VQSLEESIREFEYWQAELKAERIREANRLRLQLAQVQSANVWQAEQQYNEPGAGS
jgi:hypothetical protein